MIGRRTLLALAVAGLLLVVAMLRFGGRSADEGDIVPEVAVHVAQARRDTLYRSITAYGRVEPAPPADGSEAGGALITSLVDGVLAEIRGVEGQPVERGAVLFRLESRMQEVAVERAKQQADFAERAFQRQEQLVASDGTSQRAYLEARQQLDAARSDLAAAETDLGYRTITAPISGTVASLTARLGQHVDATTVLAQVVALDRLVVSADVPAREIGAVAVGQRVVFDSPDAAAEGRVTVVGRDVDPTTGAYRVQATIPSDIELLPGQFTDVRIVVEERPGVLVVPEGCVVTGVDGDSWVAVVEGDRARRVAVEVGLRDDGLVEVSAPGLDEGTTVVTDEAYSLPEETGVRIVGD